MEQASETPGEEMRIILIALVLLTACSATDGDTADERQIPCHGAWVEDIYYPGGIPLVMECQQGQCYGPRAFQITGDTMRAECYGTGSRVEIAFY